MGAIISRWKTKPSTVELLEVLDKDIKDLEEFRAKNQRLMKLWVGRLLFYSSALYLITCLCVYYLYFPEQWGARLITALPLLAFPALVLLVRKLFIFLFSKRTERNNEKLDDLKTQKRKILEEVMETETYKNAKLILERFDPESKKKAEAEATPVRPHMTPRPGQDLRQRHVAMATPGPVSGPMTPGGTPLRAAPGGPPEKGLAGSVASPTGMRPPGPPLARPILPRERSAVDRVIEYLVGDGPQNRYALICQQCFSHNGMALKEEFEYVAFRCAYCYFMNPARKTRPQAPRLPEFSFERRLRSESPETQSSAATETPEDSDAPEERIVSARSTRVSHSGTPWSKVHSFKNFPADDMERSTTVEPQDPTAEDPPAARESEEEEAQSQQSPSPSEDAQQEETGPQGQQQKEEESI
ncbi:endoplasmic reticulum junction formation protein lunapark-B isoform X2 [Puntigrus tetrazona]|uniref:endoplasmic reticulum junction formation protein lunapark-B isoform X2 n=1 Tax=Puntigrus tetrazona TaxID=1606681 RepID=UPI001C8AE7CA|nr:endoplasmic reticulum junction formation protein lunapark-B isoform X2 [Puntigrus tetrazona]